MKTFTLTFVLCFVMATSGVLAQIKVVSSGNVGINNTNPTYKLDVGGTFRTTASNRSLSYDGYQFRPSINNYIELGSLSYFYKTVYSYWAYFYYNPVIYSDQQLKTNITDLPSMKQKLSLLRPVSYNLKASSDENSGNSDLSKEDLLQYGLIAQEVREIFPEIVVENENGELGIMYTELITVIIQVIKDQQGEIDQLKQQVIDLQSKIK